METGRMGAVAAWTGRRLLIWGGETGRTSFVAAADGLAFDPGTDRWSRLPRGPLAGRSQADAVWTGRELIVWGGFGAGSGGNPERLTDGAAFTPGEATARLSTRTP